MYEQIKKEIGLDPFYVSNFANEGQQFVAWYLRRVLLLDVHATRSLLKLGWIKVFAGDLHIGPAEVCLKCGSDG